MVVLWRDQRNDRAWVPLTRDVLAYKGQNLRLFVNVRNDGVGSYAGMYLDDVSLVVCLADTPTPGPGAVVDGRVYIDNNLNGLYDLGEIGYPSLPVSLAPGGSVLTDGAGAYTFGAQPAGNYTVSITPPPGYAVTSPPSVAITVNATNQVVNFGLTPIVVATNTPTPNIITATPTWTPIVVTNTPTPTGPPTATPTWTPIVVTNTPTPGPVIITATPTWTPPGPPTFTPTATPIPPTGTFTPVPPTLTPPPTYTPLPGGCTNWLENSSFEDELQRADPAWYYYGEPLPPQRVTDPKREGNWSVRLGTNEKDAVSFSSVRQDVIIPINATSVELTWFYWAKADDPNDQGDYQQLLLLTPSEHPLRHQIIRELWPRNREVTDTWKERKADLKLHAGSHVVIYFNVYNNGNGKRRSMYLDDVKLMVCVPTPIPPTPTPAPTNTPVPPAPPTATITATSGLPHSRTKATNRAISTRPTKSGRERSTSPRQTSRTRRCWASSSTPVVSMPHRRSMRSTRHPIGARASSSRARTSVVSTSRSAWKSRNVEEMKIGISAIAAVAFPPRSSAASRALPIPP